MADKQLMTIADVLELLSRAYGDVILQFLPNREIWQPAAVIPGAARPDSAA